MSMNETQIAAARHGLVVRESADDDIIEVELHGKLTREDYELFAPELERKLQHRGKLRLLVIMHDFHGWRLGALWQDIRFDIRHFKHFERIALVGETRWQEWMATICMPFTTGELKFFHQPEIESARAWLREK
jgi:hypothetical protein